MHDGRVWVVVSSRDPHADVMEHFIYPDDPHPQTDPDVCDKIARPYSAIPLGGRFSTRWRFQPVLGPARLLAA